MMGRIWINKKQSLAKDARDFARQSPVLDLLSMAEQAEEWRSLWQFRTATLVRGPDNRVATEGPVVVGIRYHESFISQVPHPAEIVTILEPFDFFHPNGTSAHSLCLGRPEASLGLEFILNQVWAGLTLNMEAVRTGRGEIYNAEAAQWVRANAHRLPLTERGIFEAPDFFLRANRTFAFD